MSHTNTWNGGARSQAAMPAWLSGVLLVVLPVALGVAAALSPAGAVGVLAVVLFAGLLQTPIGRLIIVVFGPILVFQTSDAITPPKLVVLLGLGIVYTLAIVDAASRPSQRPAERAVLPSTLLLWLFVLISLVRAIYIVPAPGLTDWARDILPYVMIATVPYLSLYFARTVSHKVLLLTLLVAGGVAATAFTVEFLGRRGFIAQADPADRSPAALTSPLLAGTAIIAALVHAKGRLWSPYTAYACAVLAVLLLSGTRTFLLFLLVPLILAIFAPGHRRELLSGFTALVTGGLVFLALAVPLAGIERESLTSRFASLPAVFHGDLYDFSRAEREIELDSAIASFRLHPTFGASAGVPFSYIDPAGRYRETSVIDSPVLSLARFGVVGVIVLLAALSLLLTAALRERSSRDALPGVILLGLIILTVSDAILLSPFEDKGLAIAMLLSLAMVMSSSLTDPFGGST